MDPKVNPFKPGDRVRKKNGNAWSNGYAVATVSDKKLKSTPRAVFVEETGACIDFSSLELVEAEKPTSTELEDQSILETASVVHDKHVKKPSHYTKWAIEPITFIMRNGFEFWRGNIVKYASRAGSKMYDGMDAVESEITDLEKVRRYAEMRINQDPDLSDFELMLAAVLDIIVDDVPLSAVDDLSIEAKTATEFFNGVQALVELGDIIKDHKEKF